jgi:hypothetical protein
MTVTIFKDYTLARVNHYRCDQPAGKWGTSTYVWIPKTMTTEEFEALCDKAKKAYLDAHDAAQKTLKTPAPGYGPQYDRYPDKTVAEVKAIHAAETEEWNKRNVIVKAEQRTFAQILKDVSDGVVLGFWDIEFPIDVEVHWGHRHGTDIAYGETKITNPAPATQTFGGQAEADMEVEDL